MPSSVDLNSKKESCTHETLETNLPLTNDITSSREEVTYLRLKETNNRLTSNNRLICAHLSTNSVGNKFDSLADIIKNNFDILMILEAKLDLFFLEGDFQLYDFIFSFMTPPLNHIDLIEMKMLVEYFYLSLKIYPKNLLNLK